MLAESERLLENQYRRPRPTVLLVEQSALQRDAIGVVGDCLLAHEPSALRGITTSDFDRT
jgi:hypothetical protein